MLAHTAGWIVSGLLSVNSASVDFYHNAITVVTALSGGEIVKNSYASITGAAADADTSSLIGNDIALVSTALSQSDLVGYRVIHSGTSSGAAGTPDLIGFNCVPTTTINSGTTNFYGVNIDFTGLTNIASNDVYGIRVYHTGNVDSAIYATDGTRLVTIANNSVGIRVSDGSSGITSIGGTTGISITGVVGTSIDINADETLISNARKLITGSKDLVGVIVADRTVTNYCIDLTQNVDNQTAGNFDIANTGGMLSLSSSHTVTPTGGTKAQVDTYAGTTLFISNTATTAAVADALLTSSPMALDILYTVVVGAASTHNLTNTNIERITAIIPTGTASTGGFYINMLSLEGSTSVLNDANMTFLGLNVDFSTITNTSSAALYGIKSVVASTADGAIYASDGTNVTTLSNGTNAITTNGKIASTAAPTGLNASSISIGTYATPIVDTNASDAFAFTINMSTAVNKTSAGDSCMGAYVRIANTADGANTRLQGVLASTGVAFDCNDAYGLQSNMSIAANVNAAGNLTAISGKVTIAAASVTGGIISAGLFTLDGAFNPTATTYGIWIDNVGITSDAGLEMNNNGGTIVTALKFDGADAITTFATFNADTASKCIAPNTSAINALTAKKAIKVMVGASEYWIPCFSCTDGTGATFN
jgi:hypothetical protein